MDFFNNSYKLHVATDSIPHFEIHRQFFPIQKGWQFPKYPDKTRSIYLCIYNGMSVLKVVKKGLI